jgi:hypothetical protein
MSDKVRKAIAERQEQKRLERTPAEPKKKPEMAKEQDGAPG